MYDEKNKFLPDNFIETWSIGTYAGDSPLNLKPIEGISYPALDRHSITDVLASYVADPFMIEVKGKWYLFMEIVPSETKRGVVGLATSDDGIDWKYEKVILQEEFHLSYPFVFEHEGEHYMVPETLGAGAIRLYKAANFPYDWEHQADLTSGLYSDPTLFRHDSKWWMFAGSNPYGSNTVNLFYADTLEGPYIEHPQSPIIENNNRMARPAGRINQENGLVRLCQSSYPSYGSEVRAFEITELTTEKYSEKELEESPILKRNSEIKQWNSKGMHHLDAHQIGPNKWIACVDGSYHDKPILDKAQSKQPGNVNSSMINS
jgi:hypothetical protein